MDALDSDITVETRRGFSDRISVVGTSGSGKTTLAKFLSGTLKLPHFELDAINWLPNWQQRDPGEFKEIVTRTVREEGWVIEGNYGRTREIVWGRATVVVWLNMPFHLVFYRMLVRILRRSLLKEVLWNGNRETLAKHFFSKDSMLYWVIKTHRRRKREYRELFRDRRYGHIRLIELKGRKDVDRFIARVASERRLPED